MKTLAQYIITSLFTLCFSLTGYAKMVVVIDAGHGGKDPGAIGQNLRIQEKNVTLAISKELKALLDADPHFKAVMTRNDDSFIQLSQRTEIARKNKANLFVSIHADSSPSSNSAKGASVWVLSNRRASNEMGKWLEDHEKQSELLGGAGSLLSNKNERYLNQTVLDLQFSHSQRSGYELGKAVLSYLEKVTPLAKKTPQHASLSVLRSPDITSILVETGFLSNAIEEKQLASSIYRRKIAQAIYKGLNTYWAYHPNINKVKENNKKEVKPSPKKDSAQKSTSTTQSTATANKENGKLNNGYHIVQKNETLYSIARLYNTTPDKLSKLNKIQNNHIVVGKKLKIQ
ncbi:N-acetylmuramoyl-L-alanine amidase [[Haemophilus] ducreyi]|uniref:N-acetylmuramoyl-L-alanine amidase n=2 Tax=Haemophilus ducreyi TaxID=730 RepID=Q7VNP0_HAEDU|nr:N-acetylmuramoyl-L-alanine amidase [[Haemophilus] ducreyi]AAP95412.1 N-acetylmuramoyl-L-alanine amidase [[Haemophilus] ducreyi 35000HP]AKO30523.1 N-acetylmuramoyl-L-alanine amidase [[Haemophilus] ducreyi]AKO31958.1 N-acetylmuramoyl-L-alanine amidase [[Haemophilus] ducreyi]AKO33413.1 N-acetylmuramoyl-L-alanine amidase [[Haemophilus] ducreyi]AKO34860.1 N-acetylmuramoyl-L-alanine amidase [[Haemophilus] ducreyi]